MPHFAVAVAQESICSLPTLSVFIKSVSSTSELHRYIFTFLLYLRSSDGLCLVILLPLYFVTTRSLSSSRLFIFFRISFFLPLFLFVFLSFFFLIPILRLLRLQQLDSYLFHPARSLWRVWVILFFFWPLCFCSLYYTSVNCPLSTFCLYFS